jgi:L-alanine-DL-glutamate epimerase-like enolase superfamily enzyme
LWRKPNRTIDEGQYDLFWYEEPGDPLDFELQARLRQFYKNPMATGEDCSRCRTRAT